MLPQIVLLLLLGGGLIFVLALILLRRGRRGQNYQIRRRSWRQGGVLFILGGLMMVVGAVLGVVSGLGLVALHVTQPTRGADDLFGIALSPHAMTELAATVAASNVTLTLTDAPLSTPLPTTSRSIPFETNTQTPPTISAWSIAALSPTFDVPPRTPDPRAQLVITGVSDRPTNAGIPAQSSSRFTEGLHRLYVFIGYSQMTSGTAWTRVLYHDGTPIDGHTELWRGGGEGSNYFVFSSDDGFAPGNYEVHLLLGGREHDRAYFRVIEG